MRARHSFHPFPTPAVGAFAILILTAAALPAAADWFPGDSHKMHFPQLPDPNGWDINITGTSNEVADDWRCSETGPVSDLHFWFSVKGDDPNTSITSITARIYSDQPGLPFSRPDQLLWSRTFTGTNSFSVIPYGTGTQGFASPQAGPIGWQPNDHAAYWQANIRDIAAPFNQVQNTIYWLGLSVQVSGTSLVGWKTSLNPFQDDATYREIGGSWNELINPLNGTSLHQAFVVTPEPSTVAILAAGGLAAAGLTVNRHRRGLTREPGHCGTATDLPGRSPPETGPDAP